MNRRLAKKRLLLLEQQAMELKKRNIKSSDLILFGEFEACYQWMLSNKCLQGAPEAYGKVIEECAAPHPNKFIFSVGGFLSKFDSEY